MLERIAEDRLDTGQGGQPPRAVGLDHDAAGRELADEAAGVAQPGAELLGRDVDRDDEEGHRGHHLRIAVDVVTEIEIARPRAEVAAYACDPDKAPEWYVNIKAIEWRTPPPLQQGTRLAFVASFLGRRLEYTYEVRELVPDERFVMATAEGPFPMETTYAFEDTRGGTRMTLRNRGEPSGFSKVAAPVMAKAMRRANGKDLRADQGDPRESARWPRRARVMLSTWPSPGPAMRRRLRRMVQLMFECPTTGDPLMSTRRFMRFDGGGTEVVSLHCPRCAETHMFSRGQALLVMDEVPAKA